MTGNSNGLLRRKLDAWPYALGALEPGIVRQIGGTGISGRGLYTP
jgi:hypothetical protein